MVKHTLCALAAVALAVPAAADEMLVFRKDSAWKGAALRVVSYEKRGGRLVIHTRGGELLSAPEDAVDWELSRKATGQLHAQDEASAARRAEEERARAAAEAVKTKKALTLVEASRRYGVDKPAVSVAEGSAWQEVVSSKPAEEGGAAASRPGAAGTAGDPPAVKAAKDKLAEAKAAHDKLARQIDDLRKDTNPDPLSAAQRDSQIKAKTAELGRAAERVAAAEAALNTALQEAARRAVEKEKEKAEAPKPAEPGRPAATPTPAGR